jgi:uncharacterized protein (TIGR02147 family)
MEHFVILIVVNKISLCDSPCCMGEASELVYRISDPIEWLRAEYVRRREVNPRYSLRAFARRVRLPIGALSEIFSKRRSLTLEMGTRIAEGLSLSESERKYLLRLIEESRKKGKVARLEEKLDEVSFAYQEVNTDVFDLIADWCHYSILALMETSGFRSDPEWIARRLMISVTEVQDALERMIRLGMVDKTENGLQPTGDLSSTQDIPSSAVRRYHTQLLEKARRALEEVSLKSRDITSITIAVDVSRIGEAKKRIQRFRRRMASFLEGEAKTAVYHLNVQLIPATREDS